MVLSSLTGQDTALESFSTQPLRMSLAGTVNSSLRLNLFTILEPIATGIGGEGEREFVSYPKRGIKVSEKVHRLWVQTDLGSNLTLLFTNYGVLGKLLLCS